MPESAESLNEWQIAEIQKSLDEADRNDFATDEDVSSVIGKWPLPADRTLKAEAPSPKPPIPADHTTAPQPDLRSWANLSARIAESAACCDELRAQRHPYIARR